MKTFSWRSELSVAWYQQDVAICMVESSWATQCSDSNELHQRGTDWSEGPAWNDTRRGDPSRNKQRQSSLQIVKNKCIRNTSGRTRSITEEVFTKEMLAVGWQLWMPCRSDAKMLITISGICMRFERHLLIFLIAPIISHFFFQRTVKQTWQSHDFARLTLYLSRCFLGFIVAWFVFPVSYSCFTVQCVRRKVFLLFCNLRVKNK